MNNSINFQIVYDKLEDKAVSHFDSKLSVSLEEGFRFQSKFRIRRAITGGPLGVLWGS